jgi:hypothetical protein
MDHLLPAAGAGAGAGAGSSSAGDASQREQHRLEQLAKFQVGVRVAQVQWRGGAQVPAAALTHAPGGSRACVIRCGGRACTSQEAALRHALRLPGLRRLVYSTCSTHQRENEDVVAAVLRDAQAAGFHLAHALPGWHRRGMAIEGRPWTQQLARTDPHADGTDGFFVAVFERCAV